MLDFFKRRTSATLPSGYSTLDVDRSAGIPAELTRRETSEAFYTRRSELRRTLRLPARRPPENRALFTALYSWKGGFIWPIRMPESGQHVVPIFTSWFRAADFARTLLSGTKAIGYRPIAPAQLVRHLRADEAMFKCDRFAVDRCPRCTMYLANDNDSIQNVDDVIALWSAVVSSHQARLELYLEFAAEAALAGHVELARDVLLKALAHVDLEDPRGHYLLGQVALALGDGALLRQATLFLQYLRVKPLESQLERSVRSRTPEYSIAQ